MNKRILVVYYSLSGNTERVARDLATRLGADLERIRERTNRRGVLGHVRAAFDSVRGAPAQLLGLEKNPADYALTIVGTPVWAGRITPAARTFLESIRDVAPSIAFFTTSGGTAAEKLIPSVERLMHRRVAAWQGFRYHDLRDAAQYGHRLDELVTAVKLRPAGPAIETGVTHAHA